MNADRALLILLCEEAHLRPELRLNIVSGEIGQSGARWCGTPPPGVEPRFSVEAGARLAWPRTVFSVLKCATNVVVELAGLGTRAQ